MGEIEDKGQTMCNFPKDVAKTEGGEFTMTSIIYVLKVCFVFIYMGNVICAAQNVTHKPLPRGDPLLLYSKVLRDSGKALALIHEKVSSTLNPNMIGKFELKVEVKSKLMPLK